MNKNFTKMKAFTLVELMVVITIIAIMTSIAVFGLSSVRQKAQDTSHLAGIRDLQLAVEAYKSINGSYPAAGTGGSDYITGLTPTFLTKLPTDGYSYTVSTDKKTYCVGVKDKIFKSSSQPDLVVTGNDKSWKACRGPEAASLAW